MEAGRYLAESTDLTHCSPEDALCQTVLDYFALSSGDSGFYSRDCNNEALKMQGLAPSMVPDALRSMTGVEYALVEAQEPNIYIIRKQLRESPTVCVPLKTYYCLNGVIYQSPSVLAILTSRLSNALWYLSAACREVESKVKFLGSRYSWGSSAAGTPIAPEVGLTLTADSEPAAAVPDRLPEKVYSDIIEHSLRQLQKHPMLHTGGKYGSSSSLPTSAAPTAPVAPPVAAAPPAAAPTNVPAPLPQSVAGAAPPQPVIAPPSVMAPPPPLNVGPPAIPSKPTAKQAPIAAPQTDGTKKKRKEKDAGSGEEDNNKKAAGKRGKKK